MTQKERILEYCKNNGIRISVLEKELGFSNGYIKSVKSGYPAEKLSIIANYLKVSTDYLMGISENEKAISGKVLADIVLDDALMNAVTNLTKLDQADRDFVIAMINRLSK